MGNRSGKPTAVSSVGTALILNMHLKILVTIFQCKPVSSFWHRNPNKPSDCFVDDYAFFVGIAVPNIITDAALLSVPIPFIWRLHRDRPQKIALAGTFMLGGL